MGPDSRFSWLLWVRRSLSFGAVAWLAACELVVPASVDITEGGISCPTHGEIGPPACPEGEWCIRNKCRPCEGDQCTAPQGGEGGQPEGGEGGEAGAGEGGQPGAGKGGAGAGGGVSGGSGQGGTTGGKTGAGQAGASGAGAGAGQGGANTAGAGAGQAGANTAGAGMGGAGMGGAGMPAGPSGGLGEPCDPGDKCDPGFFCQPVSAWGLVDSLKVCTRACCDSRDCDAGGASVAVCMPSKAGGSMCLGPKQAARSLTLGDKGQGQPCAGSSECRSGLCQGNFCQDTCCDTTTCCTATECQKTTCSWGGSLGGSVSGFACSTAGVGKSKAGQGCNGDDGVCESGVCRLSTSGFVCAVPCRNDSGCDATKLQVCDYTDFSIHGKSARVCVGVIGAGSPSACASPLDCPNCGPSNDGLMRCGS